MIRRALFLLAMISIAGCASVPRVSDTAPLEAEVRRFMADPGPFWVGITDTSSLGDRIEAHVAEAEALLDQMRAVEGERTAENTLVPHAQARARFADAQRLV